MLSGLEVSAPSVKIISSHVGSIDLRINEVIFDVIDFIFREAAVEGMLSASTGIGIQKHLNFNFPPDPLCFPLSISYSFA